MQQTQEDYQEITEKVKTGEYFREARNSYDFAVHDPMAERYLYIAITALAILTFLTAYYAKQQLYPLQRPVPFIVNTSDIVDDLPRIQTLIQQKGESASGALLRFLVSNYVALHEEYNIDTLDRNINGLKSQSATPVFKEIQEKMDPRNPNSPIALYQRHSTRKIRVLKYTPPYEEDMDTEVIYEASVETRGDVKKTLWQVNIAFQYNGITLNEETEKVEPIKFVVTKYSTKRLQDEK